MMRAARPATAMKAAPAVWRAPAASEEAEVAAAASVVTWEEMVVDPTVETWVVDSLVTVLKTSAVETAVSRVVMDPDPPAPAAPKRVEVKLSLEMVETGVADASEV